MKNLILIALLALTGTLVFSQSPDSTYAVWVDGNWSVQVHPDSVVGKDLTRGPKTAYNTLTGDYFIFNPTDSSWGQILSEIENGIEGLGGIYSGSGSLPDTLVEVENQYGLRFNDVNDAESGVKVYTNMNGDGIPISASGGDMVYGIEILDAINGERGIMGVTDEPKFVIESDIDMNIKSGGISINAESFPFRISAEGTFESAIFYDNLLDLNIPLRIGNTEITISGTPSDGDIYRYNASNSQMELVNPTLTNTGIPSGSVVPDYIGQEYLDTNTDTWYKSTGLTNTDWVQISN